jgi:hypothetical protein
MAEDGIVDGDSGRPAFLDGETQVFGHPTDDGVGDDREAPGLFGLLLVMVSGHLPEPGEVQVTAQGAHGFVLVELASDLAAIVFVAQARQRARRSRPVTPKRGGGQAILP